ncbi:MAG: methyltransferase domain-containing protein [Planctomycetota bacterium]|nr:methyltransferase domain-containing protein [Planctomycetota bacterium]
MSGPVTSDNEFGANLPFDDDVAATCRALGIADSDRVLDVGGAGNAFSRADVVCDLTFASCVQRNGAPGVLRADVEYVEAPAERLPFDDNAFDFVWCTQVLEHVLDPVAACRELSRVARRGFVEVPSRVGEMTNGNPTHRWIVDLDQGELVFQARPFVDHPLRNVWYGLMYQDEEVRRLTEHQYRNVFNHQLSFEGELRCRVEAASGAVFDYDDPNQAGRAHYGFARNVLLAGAEPDYGLPDAIEAVRLLPESAPARLLLAGYLARLLRLSEARTALRGMATPDAELLVSTLDRLEGGEAVDLRGLPVPGSDPEAAAVDGPGFSRPVVTVVVVGDEASALLESAEAALTQDYAPLEVVIASSTPLGDAASRLHMADRLRIREHPADTGLAALVNRGALEAKGEVLAFIIAGDRPMAHHVERAVMYLMVADKSAVHTDRLLRSGEVAGPEIVPGNPATAAASLSTLVARRSLLESAGFLDETAADPGLDYLVRLAQSGRLGHLPEATIESPHPVPSGAEVLDGARAHARMRPLELHRSLIAASEREAGLRGRVRQLEARLREVEEDAS